MIDDILIVYTEFGKLSKLSLLTLKTIANFTPFHKQKLIDIIHVKKDKILISFNNEDGIAKWNLNG